MTPAEIAELILMFIGTASALAAITPTKKDDEIFTFVRKVLDAFACNWGHAKNKED